MISQKEKRIKKKTLEDLNTAERAIREKIITLMLGAFGLVAALAWNEAIKSLFDTVFKKQGSLIGKFLYAISVTTIIVLISLRLQRHSQANKK